MEQPVDEQEFEPGAYDVILASDVFHAARDLEQVMKNVRGLLATRIPLPAVCLVMLLAQGVPRGAADARVVGPAPHHGRACNDDASENGATRVTRV